VFSIPSGNFGNLTAGLIAKRMGLPIQHFIAATNINDIVPHYLTTKEFSPRSSASTISNAMDVGNPSNFARMLDLFHNTHSEMKSLIAGYSFTDEDTRNAMKEVFKKSNYTLDPHGAIGYLGLKKYQSQNPDSVGVFLETAHPAKFLDVVESTLQTKVEIPDGLRYFLSRKKTSIACNADFNSFKNLLQQI
jgi:threonine synthase